MNAKHHVACFAHLPMSIAEGERSFGWVSPLRMAIMRRPGGIRADDGNREKAHAAWHHYYQRKESQGCWIFLWQEPCW